MQKKTAELGIICPYCGKYSNGITADTRLTHNGRRRRRICEYCGKRYSTIEKSVVSKTCFVEGGDNDNGTDKT